MATGWFCYLAHAIHIAPHHLSDTFSSPLFEKLVFILWILFQVKQAICLKKIWCCHHLHIFYFFMASLNCWYFWTILRNCMHLLCSVLVIIWGWVGLWGFLWWAPYINPIHKKKNNLCKENYRSVNVLVVVSKLFERILSDQLMDYFASILSHSLSAYRAGYSCQHVILQLTEFWRQSLDKGNCVGTVAMDLSKAFDSMPHGLLIVKLSAYGVSKHACNLIINYLCNRRQRTKVMGKCSEWVTINRGVPQGSVLGPLSVNIFVNDLFYTDIDSMICNYANDNHLVNESNCIDTLKVSLEKDAHRAISWFDNNYMDANPVKFQCISLDRFGRPPISISVEGNTIPSSDSIKVLGVTLDSNLHYDTHISNLCSKASVQINAMKRIGKYLNTDCRIAMYKSFISSNFSYCPVSWIFYRKRNPDKLEKLQERALRFIFFDYASPYRELLKHGQFLSLSALRIRYLAIEMDKCVHGLNPPYLNELFKSKDTSYHFRDSNRLQQPEFQTVRYGFKSFPYYGSKLWNAPQAEVKKSENVNHFKKNATQWCASAKYDVFTIQLYTLYIYIYTYTLLQKSFSTYNCKRHILIQQTKLVKRFVTWHTSSSI